NARALAAQFNPPMIVDNFGEQHFSIGYVLLRTNGSQLMKFDRVSQIMRAANLPIDEMNEGDELYLYFDIPREARRRLVSFEVGDRKQEIPDGGVPVE